MSELRLYTVIYVVLFALATAQTLVEFAGLDYWVGLWTIIGLSFLKAVIVAGYYQHLRWEPRSISFVLLVGLLAALALTVASSYSIM